MKKVGNTICHQWNILATMLTSWHKNGTQICQWNIIKNNIPQTPSKVGVLQSITFCHTQDEAMSVGLAKACVPWKIYSVIEKISFKDNLAYPLLKDTFSVLGSSRCEVLSAFDLKDAFHFANVTVGNSPTAPGTLRSYQTIDWARLAHAGVNRTERNHSYHLIHNIYWDITSSQHMVHGVVKVHNITSTVHQVGHMSTTSSQVNYINLINFNYTSGMKNKIKKNQYQLWGLASKPITTSHYQ